MRYKTFNIRWNPEAATQLEALGIETDQSNFEYREARINVDRIAFFDEYEGKICINFSAQHGDILITDLAYTKANLDKLT